MIEGTMLGYPIMVCMMNGWFCMFQADHVEKGLYYAVKGSVLSLPESRIGNMDELSTDDSRDVFPVKLCRAPDFAECRFYNKKKTV